MFVYYPVVDNLRLSLFRWDAFSTTETLVGLGNYQDLTADPVFWSSLFNNVAYAVVSVIFQVAGGLVLAAVLEELVRGRWKDFFRTVYFIPAVLSLTIVGLLFQFMYNPQIGLVNGLLGRAAARLAAALLARRVGDGDLVDHRHEPVAVDRLRDGPVHRGHAADPARALRGRLHRRRDRASRRSSGSPCRWSAR